PISIPALHGQGEAGNEGKIRILRIAKAEIARAQHDPTRLLCFLELRRNGPLLRAPNPPFLAHRLERAHASFVASAAGFDPAAQPRFLLREPLVEERVLLRLD